MREILKSLLPGERRAFGLHLLYSFIEGVILGVLALNEYVLIKSLKGTDFQIGLLFQFSVILLLFSVILNEWIRRSSDKARLIRTVAWITRVPLFFLLFFPRSVEAFGDNQLYNLAFLGIFLLFYLANPIIYPVINLFLKNSYRHHVFGSLYSYATSLNKAAMLLATFLFGIWLDADPYVFVYVYPVLALLGIISIYILSRIPHTPMPVELEKRGFWKSVTSSILNMMRIFRTNKPYRDFETGFALYGFAWMTTIAVITIFFDKVLNLSYSSVAFYKNSYNLIAIVLLPLFGKLIGKIDPRKFGVYTFLSLFFYLFFLMLTQYLPGHITIFGIQLYYMLIPAFLSHAVFAATMALLWYIGSAYFSKPEEAADYQSIHLTMTGIRGLYGPILGVLLYQLLGLTWTLVFAMIALLTSVWILLWSMHRHPVKVD
ncbi:MAG: MFS transporter [Bacteroidales bacterium]